MKGATYDAIVLGAGAAGLFCAALAGARGRRVLVLDHAPRPGRKILISGGGRANFTNLGTTPEHFLSENPHFSKSALARFAPGQFVELVEQHRIRYHAKAPGQLFCDGPASQIVDMLLTMCRASGCVELLLPFRVTRVEEEGSGYTVQGEHGVAPRTFTAPALVIATGGLSIPKLGATGFGYELAQQFGLRVVEPRPALVPLVWAAEDAPRWEGLSGVASEAVVSLRGARAFRGPVLWTHRGLSGPAVLQISSYWRAGDELVLDLAPDREVYAPVLGGAAARPRNEAAIAEVMAAAFPRRLAARLHELGGPASLKTAAITQAEERLHHWPVHPAGTEGFSKAEVTAGGIATEELDARSMEAKRQPGLFAIGEVVDVTGQLGGYNFQWAWASAAAAAQAL